MHDHIAPFTCQLVLPCLRCCFQNSTIRFLALYLLMLPNVPSQERQHERIDRRHDPVRGTRVRQEREIRKGFVARADEREERAVRVTDEAVEASKVARPEGEAGRVDCLSRSVSSVWWKKADSRVEEPRARPSSP
jgi:hypothetical protein